MATGAGLATAFFRLYILHALDRGPARPAALLSSLHASEGVLPVETGTFSRALQQLLDAGLVLPGAAGAMELTAMGRREREAQRAVWARLVAVVGRMLADALPAPEPPTGGGTHVVARASDRVPDQHRERVALAEIRDAARRARETGEPLGVALADIVVTHPRPMRARQMVQRCLRETLGSARSTFAAGTSASRCGPTGICLVVRGDDVEAQAEILRARVLESLGSMSATVRAFADARFAVRAGAARWSSAVATSAELLRLAEGALAADAERRAA